MVLDEVEQNGFGLRVTLEIEKRDGVEDVATLGVGIDGGEVGSVGEHVCGETIVQRLDERAGEIVWLVADFFEMPDEDGVAPLGFGDKHLAAVGVVHADHVGILGRIVVSRRNWRWFGRSGGSCRSGAFAEEFFEKAHK